MTRLIFIRYDFQKDHFMAVWEFLLKSLMHIPSQKHHEINIGELNSSK